MRVLVKRPLEVVIVDFDMKFFSMVRFMVRWTFASIPAMLAVLGAFLLFFLALGLFGLSLSGLSRMLRFLSGR